MSLNIFPQLHDKKAEFIYCTSCKKLCIIKTDEEIEELKKTFICDNCQQKGKDWMVLGPEQRRIEKRSW